MGAVFLLLHHQEHVRTAARHAAAGSGCQDLRCCGFGGEGECQSARQCHWPCSQPEPCGDTHREEIELEDHNPWRGHQLWDPGPGRSGWWASAVRSLLSHPAFAWGSPPTPPLLGSCPSSSAFPTLICHSEPHSQVPFSRYYWALPKVEGPGKLGSSSGSWRLCLLAKAMESPPQA